MIQPSFDCMLPESEWRLPDEFPDLVGRGARFLTVDVESRDPRLRERGPGFVRGDASIAGIAVGADGFRRYYPVAHLMGGNLAPNVVLPWVVEQLESLSGDREIYGAHLLYDLEALWCCAGLRDVRAKLRDVQLAEPCIDEETAEGYSLEVLARKYLGEGKEEQVLREAASCFKKEFKSKRGPGTPFDSKTDLWMLPSQYVGAYAEADVDRPERIFQKQRTTMEAEGTWRYFDGVESPLIWILLLMRIKGVRVDLGQAEVLRRELTTDIDRTSDQIKELLGWHPNIDSGPDLARAYDQLSVPYPGRTKAGAPSFAKEVLAESDHPLSKLVLKKRRAMTLRDDYVVGDVIGSAHRGRIHCQMSSLKQDDGGTRTSRFSSKNPNLQQVPKRDKVWGPKIRSLFVADDGEEVIKADVHQQEPRLTVHYAALSRIAGIQAVVQAFREDPMIDYHQMTTDIINQASGESFERSDIKEINLGIVYTMGLDKLCRKLGVDKATGRDILDKYHAALPFVRKIQDLTTRAAEARGRIRTIAGYVCRFNLWEPARERGGGFAKNRGLPLEEAQARWPGKRLVRWGTHKALNKLIQGSAAGQIKVAMVRLWQEHRIFCLLQVHDELVDSGDRDRASTIKRTMECAVPLVIPVVAEATMGPSWGNAKSPVGELAATPWYNKLLKPKENHLVP